MPDTSICPHARGVSWKELIMIIFGVVLVVLGVVVAVPVLGMSGLLAIAVRVALLVVTAASVRRGPRPAGPRP